MAALHDCRQGGSHIADEANKKLRLQRFQVCERERQLGRRLDAALHINNSLRAEIARLHHNVLQDRDHCNRLLQRYTSFVEAAAQYDSNLELEIQTKALIRSIKQKAAAVRRISQVCVSAMAELNAIAVSPGCSLYDGMELCSKGKRVKYFFLVCGVAVQVQCY
jgi:hypothetical protein